MLSSYFDYCAARGWVAFSSRNFTTALPDLMLELFRSAHSTHIVREGKRQKGYPNIAFIQ